MPGARCGAGPGWPYSPQRFPTRATEAFLVLAGALRVLLGEEALTPGIGDFLTGSPAPASPNAPQAFAPTSGEEGDMLVVLAPGTEHFDHYRLLASGAPGVKPLSRTPVTAPSGTADTTSATTSSTAWSGRNRPPGADPARAGIRPIV
ncbi:hypothetical protein ACIRQY_32790 [Streptomyces sp. NPDC101490]|uniref:hypothetical protein n=1 Tax=Streptomyces sp. NPDC101490 TaxID=3366143 RepID=UPI0038270D9F